MLSPPKDSHQGKTPWHTRGKPIRLHNGDLEWMPSMQNVLLSSVPQPGPLINPSRTMPRVMFITTSRGLPGMGQGLQTRGCSEFCCPKCSHLVTAFLGFRESSLCVVISLGVCQGRPCQPVLSVVAMTTPPQTPYNFLQSTEGSLSLEARSPQLWCPQGCHFPV